ncbi:MAG: hypothetical protein GWP64_02500 [Gammaproteobacteria bacterium]|nr:hypothetical protein [Gammaproteobacteria bacterium]
MKTWLKTTGTCANDCIRPGVVYLAKCHHRRLAAIAQVVDGDVVEPLAQFIGDGLVRLLPTAQDYGDLSRRRRGLDHRRFGLGLGFRNFDDRLRRFDDFGYRLDRLRLRPEQRTTVQQEQCRHRSKTQRARNFSGVSVHPVPLQFLTSGRRQQTCPGYSLAFTGFVKRVLCAAS